MRSADPTDPTRQNPAKSWPDPTRPAGHPTRGQLWGPSRNGHASEDHASYIKKSHIKITIEKALLRSIRKTRSYRLLCLLSLNSIYGRFEWMLHRQWETFGPPASHITQAIFIVFLNYIVSIFSISALNVSRHNFPIHVPFHIIYYILVLCFHSLFLISLFQFPIQPLCRVFFSICSQYRMYSHCSFLETVE